MGEFFMETNRREKLEEEIQDLRSEVTRLERLRKTASNGKVNDADQTRAADLVVDLERRLKDSTAALDDAKLAQAKDLESLRAELQLSLIHISEPTRPY